MKNLFLVILFLAIALPAQAQVETTVSKKFLNLTAGITTDEKVPLSPDSPEFKGDYKKITKLSYDKGGKVLRFEPFGTGVGTLTILDERGRKVLEYVITVKKTNLETVLREMKSLLGEIEGISIKVINNKVVVDGEILLPRDMNRIMAAVSQFDGQAAAMVTLSPIAQKKIAEIIEKDINNPEITCRAVNGKFILEGMAGSKDEKDRAFVIAQTYVPDYIVGKAEQTGDLKTMKATPVINLIGIKDAPEAAPKKIIQLVVHYVELNKDYSNSFRFQFTPSIDDGTKFEFASGNRQPGGIISSITGTINNLLPKLNWAKEHGHARILQSSSVIVQEGQAGKISSVTRIPYQTIGKDGQTNTQFEESGIITDITPTITNANSDAIALSVNFKLKSLVGSTAQGPLISDNSIQTAVTVRSSQSAAIGGLVSNSSGTDYNKLPKNTSDNPLISLYSSKSFRRNQSQFVVFITPIIKNSASTGSEKIKQKFRLRD